MTKEKKRELFGDRLRLARKKAGYSLRGLSNVLGTEVSAQAIGKYERGEMMPGSAILLRLMRVLDVSIEFLLSNQVEGLEAIEFRKLSGTTAGDRAKVEATVIDCLQRYLVIEEILGVDSGAWKQSKNGNRFLGEESDGETLAKDLREEWKLGLGPIPNMTALLEDQGIKVLVIPLPEKVSGLTCLVRRPQTKNKVPVIVINQDVTLERRRLTLAHELAHRLISNQSLVDHEKASNVFAGAFLIPQEHLVKEIGKHRKALGYKELVDLKRMYRVSAAVLLVRLKQIGVINESTLSYAFQTFARKWRKTEPEPMEDLGQKGTWELPRRFERLCYRALAERLISLGKASELLQQARFKNRTRIKGAC